LLRLFAAVEDRRCLLA